MIAAYIMKTSKKSRSKGSRKRTRKRGSICRMIDRALPTSQTPFQVPQTSFEIQPVDGSSLKFARNTPFTHTGVFSFDENSSSPFPETADSSGTIMRVHKRRKQSLGRKR